MRKDFQKKEAKIAVFNRNYLKLVYFPRIN